MAVDLPARRNKWVELARDRCGARTLVDAARGRVESSPRYRDIFEPLGPGERWLEEIGSPDYSLPLEFHVVAARLRRLKPSEESVPRLRVRTKAGRWAVLHACRMPAAGDGAIAVIVEEARPAAVAPIVMMAYGLTEQERVVTGLSCQGFSTREIADHLHLSYTRSTPISRASLTRPEFASRRELVATILRQQYVPRAAAGKQLGPSGFYAGEQRRASRSADTITVMPSIRHACVARRRPSLAGAVASPQLRLRGHPCRVARRAEKQLRAV